MSRTPTHEDASLILRLYELRREARLRQARTWFMSSFHAADLAELQKLCPPGSEENASYRMVASYWDMAASFVTNGVLHPELFYQSHQELLFIYERMRHLIPEIRAAAKNPRAWKNLEEVAQGHLRWLEKEAPEFYEYFSNVVRNLGKTPAPFPAEDDEAH
jgi:hypothetical protein